MTDGKRYPYAAEGMTRDGDRGVMVWTEPGRGNGKTFRLDWAFRGETVVVKEMTDPGDYWINNRDLSQGGTPATWQEIDSFPVDGTPLDADRKMREYARERLGVVHFAGDPA